MVTHIITASECTKALHLTRLPRAAQPHTIQAVPSCHSPYNKGTFCATPELPGLFSSFKPNSSVRHLLPYPSSFSSSTWPSAPTNSRHFRTSLTSAAMHPQRIEPAIGQESVWDYPRPPRLEHLVKHIVIKFNGQIIADTHDAYRVLETSHPPVYYIPQKDLRMQYVHKSPGSSFCEWKGSATYWTVGVGDKSALKVGWSYENPTPGFVPIKSHIAFYCVPMDSCTVDGEVVQPQPGGFYGGWITNNIVGPFKGGAGSWGW